jgi:hypothetical protein
MSFSACLWQAVREADAVMRADTCLSSPYFVRFATLIAYLATRGQGPGWHLDPTAGYAQ